MAGETNVLVEHARRELALIEEEPELIEQYVETIIALVELRGDTYTFFRGDYFTMIALFEQTCDYSPTEVVFTLAELLHLKPLSPLTDNPDEWVHHKDVVHEEGVGIWQNRRNPGAFSNDGGKTYSLLSEGHLTRFGARVHTAQPHAKD